MQIKKFTARTEEEACSAARRELGQNIVILHSRNVETGGFFGLFKRQRVEITAASDDRAKTRSGAGEFSASEVADVRQPLDSRGIEDAVSFAAALGARARTTPRPSSDADTVEMRAELVELRRLVEEMVQKGPRYTMLPAVPEDLRPFFTALTDCGVKESLAKELIEELYAQLRGTDFEDVTLVEQRLLERMGRMLNVTLPTSKEESVVVALVGPTGDGKTTTLCKLALRRELYGATSVAIVSADNYRLAAAEQLKLFAGLADIPLEVVYTHEEAKDAVARQRDRDLILVDTPGRSPRDAEQFSKLKALMDAIQPDETHLVLSATVKTDDLLASFKHYEELPVTAILFTKLDETKTLGGLLNFAARVNEPISYVTFGQDIPEDLWLARSERLAEMILRNSVR